MDPTSFRFLLTMPGDSRLVGAIRELTNQAGAYAKLPTDEAGVFVQRVAAAAESVIAATGLQDAPIEFRFYRNADTLRVTITWRDRDSEERREVEQKFSA
jgi:hypothetical protein